MTKKIDNFIQMVKREARASGIKVRLPKSKTVMIDGVKVNGYFDDEDEMVLKCAIGKPEKEWFPIFVHEYCHFRQYIEKPSAWRTYSKEKSDIFFSWIQGQNFHAKTVKRFVKRTVAIELDCEKRVAEAIDKFDLPIDRTEYIKKANAYIYFYPYALTTRKWYKKAPYTIPLVYNKFSKSFNGNYNVVPDKYIKLYNDHCM